MRSKILALVFLMSAALLVSCGSEQTQTTREQVKTGGQLTADQNREPTTRDVGANSDHPTGKHETNSPRQQLPRK